MRSDPAVFQLRAGVDELIAGQSGAERIATVTPSTACVRLSCDQKLMAVNFRLVTACEYGCTASVIRVIVGIDDGTHRMGHPIAEGVNNRLGVDRIGGGVDNDRAAIGLNQGDIAGGITNGRVDALGNFLDAFAELLRMRFQLVAPREFVGSESRCRHAESYDDSQDHSYLAFH